jgi:hypothetical protein
MYNVCLNFQLLSTHADWRRSTGQTVDREREWNGVDDLPVRRQYNLIGGLYYIIDIALPNRPPRTCNRRTSCTGQRGYMRACYSYINRFNVNPGLAPGLINSLFDCLNDDSGVNYGACAKPIARAYATACDHYIVRFGILDFSDNCADFCGSNIKANDRSVIHLDASANLFLGGHTCARRDLRRI